MISPRFRIVVCQGCGGSFTTRSTCAGVRCPDCRKVRKKAVSLAYYYDKAQAQRREVKDDAIDNGEIFRPEHRIKILDGDQETKLDFDGANIPMLELEYMAHDGALPEGTKVQYLKTGAVYKVKRMQLVMCAES